MTGQKQQKRTKKGGKSSNKRNFRIKIGKATPGQKKGLRAATARVIRSLGSSTADYRKCGAELARCLAVPSQAPNLRLTVSGDSLPTSTTLLHNIFTYDASKSSNTYGPLVPNGSMPIVYFRDPLRSLITYVTNNNYDSMSYVAEFSAGDKNLASARDSYISPKWFKAEDTTVYPFTPHGNYLYMGTLQSVPTARFVWVDKHTEFLLKVTAVQTGDKLVVLKATSTTDLEEEATEINDAGVFTWHSLSSYGYYTFQFRPALSFATREIDYFKYRSDPGEPFADCFGHQATPAVDQHIAQLSKIRVNATSLLISPVASLLNQSGTIHAVYQTDVLNWPAHIVTKSLNDGAGQENFLWTRKSYQNGMYSFLKPAGIDDFKWRTEARYDAANSLEDLSYPLDSEAGYIAAVVSVITNSETSIAGSAIVEVTHFQALEWVPSSQSWTETHLPDPRYGSIATLEAIDILRCVATFHDNPLHLAAIKRGLQSAYRFTRNNRGTLSKLLTTLFPSLSPGINLGSAALGALPEW